MASSNVAFIEEDHHEPNAMAKPTGSGFGAEEHEELSSRERSENVRANKKNSTGSRGRSGSLRTRYGWLSTFT